LSSSATRVATGRARRPNSGRRLKRAGHACWLDTSDIPGGEVWLAAIADGIERAYAVVSVVSAAANASEWVRLEYLHAKKRGKHIVPLLAGDCEPPWYMADRQTISIRGADYADGVQRLLRSLPAAPPRTQGLAPAATQRAAELAYLRRLEVGELMHTELYTPMAGVARVLARGDAAANLPAIVMRPEFRHLRHLPVRGRNAQRVAHVRGHRAGFRPGAPGGAARRAGRRQDDHAVEAGARRAGGSAGRRGRADSAAGQPGQVDRADEKLRAFLERQLGELGAHLGALLESGRAICCSTDSTKCPPPSARPRQRRSRPFSWRSAGLPPWSLPRTGLHRLLSLDLDTVSIRPLDPAYPRFRHRLPDSRARRHCNRPAARAAAGQARGEDLFWRLAGGQDVRQAWEAWQAAGASLSLFWSATEIPRANPDIYSRTTAAMDRAWQQAVHDPRSLMRLAGNPYLLYMLTRVYLDSGDVPENRAVLFDRFVEVLLLRERLAEVAKRKSMPAAAHHGRRASARSPGGPGVALQSRRGTAPRRRGPAIPRRRSTGQRPPDFSTASCCTGPLPPACWPSASAR
jgi:hypothetical protein